MLASITDTGISFLACVHLSVWKRAWALKPKSKKPLQAAPYLYVSDN